MLDVTAAAKPTTPKAITIKVLAKELEEQHQLSKRQALKLMEDLIGTITKHLVVGERVKIVGLGFCKCGSCCPHGPQSEYRRTDPDQGQQEGGLPCQQRTQRGSLIAIHPATPRDGAIITSAISPDHRRKWTMVQRLPSRMV